MKIVLFLLLFISAQAWGLAEYYSLSRSIRALGMGNAFYSLSDDEAAIFYNPAGLARYDGGGQVFLSTQVYAGTDLLSSISTVTDALSASDAETVVANLTSLQGKFNSGGVAVTPFILYRGLVVGGMIGDVKGNLAILGRDLDMTVDVTTLNDSGLFVGKAFRLGKRVTMGLTGKLVYRFGGRATMDLLDVVQQQPFDFEPLDNSGLGIDFDWGMNLELAKPPFGDRFGVSLVVQNIIATDFGGGPSAPPGLVRTVSGGAYCLFKNGMSARLDLAEFGLGGFSDPDLGGRGGSFFKHVHLGWEYGIGRFALRAGVYQGQLTAGFGLTLPFLRLDFATFGEELARTPGQFSSRRFALRLALGFGFVPRQPYAGGRG